MMGDNRALVVRLARAGARSRAASLIGKVVATYWPPQRLSIK